MVLDRGRVVSAVNRLESAPAFNGVKVALENESGVLIPDDDLTNAGEEEIYIYYQGLTKRYKKKDEERIRVVWVGRCLQVFIKN